MTLGRVLYGALSQSLSPLAPGLLKARVRQGKEEESRLNERFARDLPARPEGSLVWLHGASVGESLLQLALGEALLAARPDLSLLFTSQTLTSARLLAGRMTPAMRHQMAPLDTPAAARRFIAHWRPQLGVFAEGEIWPNLVDAAATAGTRLALINGRMTERSARGWRRWPGTARAVFGRFDVILAADGPTAERLQYLSGRPVAAPGNLKSALPPPLADPAELYALSTGFKGDKPCLLAASTHSGEEDLFLDALAAGAPEAKAVIAPRHPERGADVAALLNARGIAFARRSAGEVPGAETQVLLADTMGEMGLWLRFCDGVYLGGAHARGVGGHNPVEAVRLGKPVVTGAEDFNFSEMFAALSAAGALQVARMGDDLAPALQTMARGETRAPDQARLDAFFAKADAPLAETLVALESLLDAKALA